MKGRGVRLYAPVFYHGCLLFASKIMPTLHLVIIL
jgi:hypothetical protein